MRPGHLAGGVGDQVLADFDFDMGQSAVLAVDRNAVVAVLGDRVRRIVADRKVGFLTQQISAGCRPDRILVVEHADLHRSAFPFETRRETVHGDQDGASVRAPGIEQAVMRS